MHKKTIVDVFASNKRQLAGSFYPWRYQYTFTGISLVAIRYLIMQSPNLK